MRRQYLRRAKIHLSLVTLAGISAACLALSFSSCSRKDNSAVEFLSNCGLRGIDPPKIVRASSTPAINKDYQNKNYFVLVRFTKREFEEFVASNEFKSEDVLAIPSKDRTGPTVPDWWDPPKIQTNLFSKKNGQMRVTVLWTDGTMFLFGKD